MTLYSIDLFAGAGGITTGFKMAGIKSLYANELSAEYAATFKTFHSDVEVDVGDIRELSPIKIMRRRRAFLNAENRTNGAQDVPDARPRQGRCVRLH